MSEEFRTLFVYHTDQRRRLRGCMPFFVVVSALLLVGGVLLVPIRLSEKQELPRTGRVYFRNDPLLHFHLRQLSPRPFELPQFVDPATRSFGRLEVPVLPESRFLWVQPPSPLSGAGDTFVLEGVDLLALPPASGFENAEESGAAASSSQQDAGDRGGIPPLASPLEESPPVGAFTPVGEEVPQ